MLATPLAEVLKKRFPEAHVHWLGSAYNARVLEGNPFLERVWVWDVKKRGASLSLLSLLWRLRQVRFDLAIAVFTHTPSFTNLWIARMISPATVWSFETASYPETVSWSRHLSDVEVAAAPTASPEWRQYQALVQPLVGEMKWPAPQYVISRDHTEEAVSRWKTYGFPLGQPKVGVFLAGNAHRSDRLWPAASWRAFLEPLNREKHVSLIAIGSPPGFLNTAGAAQHELYEEVAQGLGFTLPVYRELSLPRQMAFIKGLDLFICPDGGTLHLAIASHVNTIGLFIRTEASRWLAPVPWACGVQSPTPETVRRAVDERLKGLIL